MTVRTYTHPSVLEGIAAGAGWADPCMNPEEIDWSARQARAAIPFEVIDGRPVNPCESTGIRYGRNEFGHWGEALMADALVTCTHAGYRHLLMIERGDGHGWAVPGGQVEPGELPAVAALRELREETGLDASGYHYAGREMPARYVPDPRASDEAWAVTVPVHVDLGPVLNLPEVTGADDARRAEWIPAKTYWTVVGDLEARHGARVFPAHVEMLTEFLGTRAQR